ncbi:hypothetical protein Prudu_009515 [Prunus dulcis]|uniref:Uncharacterized protein n=1 Tax=Prunus dulcis TaxID=3755 RepID=A0A4Y1R6I4_PRUDU|nr:hypothetical protein Prudu_009515 [Prunus dulcis]
MIFTDMYRHGFRLPFHPWVQMMLAKLGYAPGQYNPNFWILLHGVYIAWWLAGLGEPTFEQFMYLYSISKQQRNFGWVQAIAERRRRGAISLDTSPQRRSPGGTGGAWLMGTGSVLQGREFSEVGPYLQGERRRGEWVRAQLSETERECGNLSRRRTCLSPDCCKEVREHEGGRDIDEAEMQKRLRESRAKKAEKSAGKRPRDDDEGRVADVLGKRKAIEEAHQHVMGSGPRLPPFDLQAPPKLPFGMEDASSAEEGGQPGDAPTGGALGERLLGRREERPEALAKTPASSFVDRAQKTILTSAYAFGEMYVSMAKADKEIQRLKRRDQQAKSKVAEAEEAIERRTPCWRKRRPWPRRWRLGPRRWRS